MVILILRMRLLIKLFLRYKRGINSAFICDLINHSLLSLSTEAVSTLYRPDFIMRDWDNAEVGKA